MGHLGIFNFLVKFPSGREGTVLWEGVHWLQQKADIGKERGRMTAKKEENIKTKTANGNARRSGL